MRSPFSFTSPAAMRPGGSSRPMTAEPVIDLPAPDSPTTPSTSPGWIASEMSSTATSVPRRVGNSTRRLRTSRSGPLVLTGPALRRLDLHERPLALADVLGGRDHWLPLAARRLVVLRDDAV